MLRVIDQELTEIFRQLRELRASYDRGEVDAEGNPTAFGRLVRTATKVEVKR